MGLAAKVRACLIYKPSFTESFAPPMVGHFKFPMECHIRATYTHCGQLPHWASHSPMAQNTCDFCNIAPTWNPFKVYIVL